MSRKDCHHPLGRGGGGEAGFPLDNHTSKISLDFIVHSENNGLLDSHVGETLFIK
ncbi:hypothetical protein AB6F11_08045 [Vibrio sp. 10N.247.311.14]|uniref:hypothetical protein n=1 Tax=unclassified Vibrio TaxID=2614977 RepID=UPI00354E8F79